MCKATATTERVYICLNDFFGPRRLLSRAKCAKIEEKRDKEKRNAPTKKREFDDVVPLHSRFEDDIVKTSNPGRAAE